MPGKCDICVRGPQFGHNVSHSKRRTNRRWNVNTQKRHLPINGTMQLVNICTRCLRTLSKTDRKAAS